MKALLFAAFAAIGCSSTTTQVTTGCAVAFEGNVAESASSCSVSSAGGTLTLKAASPQIAGLTVDIKLGALAVGDYSSANVAEWSAEALGTTNCAFGAGNAAVPVGSFTLHLDSVDGDTAHGKLDALLYVHSPPQTKCGAGDVESVTFVF